MPSFFSYFLPELTRAARATLTVAALVTVALPQAQAAGVSGQGTWGATLQGRDLDGNAANGYEAYYDTVLNITWLADANYAKTSGYDADGKLNWDAAKAWAAGLNINGVTGWRLPNIKPVAGGFHYVRSDDGSTDIGYNITSTHSELAHLYYVTLGNKGYVDTTGALQAGYGLSNTGPFSNVQASAYWSSEYYGPGTYEVWSFLTDRGYQYSSNMYNSYYAWAVRSGDVAAAVPESQSYALALAGLAVAVAVRRRR